MFNLFLFLTIIKKCVRKIMVIRSNSVSPSKKVPYTKFHNMAPIIIVYFKFSKTIGSADLRFFLAWNKVIQKVRRPLWHAINFCRSPGMKNHLIQA